MGCVSSKSKETVAVPWSPTTTNSNTRNRVAWTDETSVRTEAKGPAISASSSCRRRNNRKSTRRIRVRVKSADSSSSSSINTVTEVEDLTTTSRPTGHGDGRRQTTTVVTIRNSDRSLEGRLVEDAGSSPGSPSKRAVSSATSADTYDSGLEVDCPGMITESSELTELQRRDTEIRPVTPDLSLLGSKVESRKRSGGKAKPRAQTTAAILGELQSQGLLTAASAEPPLPTKTQSGMAFEVMVAPEFGILRRPPPRLAKLKKKRKKQRDMTIEEVEMKMKAAEERRERKAAKMIERLNTTAKERHVQAALDSSVESQRAQTRSKVTQDLDAAAQRREEHLRAMQRKLADRQHHAEGVRRAKLERSSQPTEPRPAPETDTDDVGKMEEASSSLV